MKELTLVIEDDKLRAAIESVANETGSTFEEVVVQALELWKREFDLDEIDLSEIKSESPNAEVAAVE